MSMTTSENGIPYGFVITRLGFNLLAKWGAGAERVIDDMWVGSGRIEEGLNPIEFTDLINPIAQATSSVPQTVDSQIQFVLEYRNELHTEVAGFWLNEFGVFAIDPDIGRILLCYGTLGDYPEWTAPFTSGILHVRRYPISIGVGGEGEIVLSYPANAFMTADEVDAFFLNAASNMVEISDADLPAVGTRIHYLVTAESNYRYFGMVTDYEPVDPPEPPIE